MGSITNPQRRGRTRRWRDTLTLSGGLVIFILALGFMVWGAIRSTQGLAAGWLLFMGCLVLPGLGWLLTTRGARAIPVQINGRWYAWGVWMSGSLLMLLGLLLFLIEPEAYLWVIDLVWGFVLLLGAVRASLPKWVWITLLVTPLSIAGVVGLIVSIIQGGLY